MEHPQNTADMHTLEKLVDIQYNQRSPARNGWADWFHTEHIPLVGNLAVLLAGRFGADPALARAGALLHDIGDAVILRNHEVHEDLTLHMGRTLMRAAGFDEQQVSLVVDDALCNHSCRAGHMPQSKEGKVLAAADAIAHLSSDFYRRALYEMSREGMHYVDALHWAQDKIERDLYNKLQSFPELQEEYRPHYELLKTFFQ